MFATKLKCRLKTKTKAKSICDEFNKMKISYLNKIKYYEKLFLKQTTAYMYIVLKVTCEHSFSTHLDIFLPVFGQSSTGNVSID